MKLPADAKQRPQEKCNYCARPYDAAPDQVFVVNMADSAMICDDCVLWLHQVVVDARTVIARGETVEVKP